MDAGLVACEGCGLLCRAPHAASMHCPRCGHPLHWRKPNSLSRTWALILSAYILYIPANVLPMMTTRTLLGSQDDTIMSGVIFLWKDGSWPLAALVFFASITVPLLKLLALTLLVVSVQLKSHWQPVQRTRLYRLVEFVGRWSMLDIYVVTILVALVQLQALAAITPGPAAVAFGAVVVLTMAAALTFDPRSIWDPIGDERGR
ncbi:MAG TPA: paraquat-inducible protein A [Casimicrobiaceae bacterium]|nr:paraquat-inducible protein A [Casimicrobiaceae bacterium]